MSADKSSLDVPLPTDEELRQRLQEVVGYLNFSSGTTDPKFLQNLSELFAAIEPTRLTAKETLAGDADFDTLGVLNHWLRQRMDELAAKGGAFGDLTQAEAALALVVDHFQPSYREFHHDLMWHRKSRQLWRPFFLGRVFETVLAVGGPWDETQRLINETRDRLDDFIGYRPLPTLENEERIEPYRHEWVRPIPVYIESAGVAHGRYAELIKKTLTILQDSDSDLLREAWFDPNLLEELAIDPRAYDFDHPVNKRPNYHFGQWDPNRIDNRGFYRRFVLQQISLDSLLSRVEQAASEQSEGSFSRDELTFEAAAVLAGTILMASGTCGDGPNRHSSEVTLSTLLPHIAEYRDAFYEQLLARAQGPHGERLRAEAARMRQPFAGARQHLNHELARRRADQLQHVHLAQLYARMGYSEAAQKQAGSVRVASARMLSKIYCRLTDGHRALDARRLHVVGKYLNEIEDLLRRGIECGALVDPWCIVGFGGNFSLFPALENTVHDYRVDDLVKLVEQALDLCSRAWTEAAAVDDAEQEEVFSSALGRIGDWWDRFATPMVASIRRLYGKEIEVSTNLVAGALNAWHKAGAAAGDVGFWRMFVDQFDTPKAFALVIEALLDHDDLVASMALMMQWVSQSDLTPLEDGDASFYPLAERWVRLVEAEQTATGDDQWPRIAKFFAHLEASADEIWHVPEFELGEEWELADDPLDDLLDDEYDDLDDDLDGDGLEGNLGNFDPKAIDDDIPFGDPSDDQSDGDPDDELPFGDPDDELDNLFSAAYEDVSFRGESDDGMDSSIFDPSMDETQYELEEEAERIEQRLNFLGGVSRLWKYSAIVWGAFDKQSAAERSETLEAWQREATSRYVQLGQLLETVHGHRIPTPRGTQESLMEYDRRRMVKDALQEQIMVTAVEMSDAGRFLRAAADAARPPESVPTSALARTIEILRAVLVGDAESVRLHWQDFCDSLVTQPLLYIPLSKGGAPGDIVKARALHRLINDLAGWLPRLGLVRESCELLDVAQRMEVDHPVGRGAVTEYDRLFEHGYKAIVRCLVASADGWDKALGTRSLVTGAELSINEPAAPADARPSDSLLVQALQDLTESQLERWLRHSRTVRLSVVERVGSNREWKRFVEFVTLYGKDLFTQRFLNLANLRAILHQGVSAWLSNLQDEENEHDLLLLDALGDAAAFDHASDMLSIAIEAVVENYREYRDYNSTTTQSDHGELLHTFIDFIRLRTGYDRITWNLKPVFLAHQILVRQGRSASAEMWRGAVAERTESEADAHLASMARMSEQYGMRLPSVAERLAERFVRPLAIDRLRALARPAMEAVTTADGEGNPTFAVLEDEIESLMRDTCGAGLDVPDWMMALEEEVTTVRRQRRRHFDDEQSPLRVEQAQLSWDEIQTQLSDD